MRRIIKLIAILTVLLCIGTASAEEETGSITVYLKNVEGTVIVFRADAYAEKDPDILAAFVKDHEIPGITRQIAADTPTVFADLPQGRYLVTHKEAAFRPFLVTIPITINGTSDFDVEARPKTQDLQSPQTGDLVDLWFICATLFISLMGIGWMAITKFMGNKSAIDEKECSERVQN